MFTVYHSNQLDLLKTLTSALIARDPLADPFQQEVVLVQSPGMICAAPVFAPGSAQAVRC